MHEYLLESKKETNLKILSYYTEYFFIEKTESDSNIWNQKDAQILSLHRLAYIVITRYTFIHYVCVLLNILPSGMHVIRVA